MLPRSLRRKILWGYIIIVTLTAGLAVVASVDSILIERKILEGQKVADLFDAVLQIRRFEKNFMLYHQDVDHQEARDNLAAARILIDRNPEAFEPLIDRLGIENLRSAIESYDHLFGDYAAAYGRGHTAGTAVLEIQLRQAGKDIATAAERLAAAERELLRTSVKRQRELLLAAVAVLTVLALLVGQMVAQRVVRSLRHVEKSMNAVARGQLARIDLPGEDGEIVSLTTAFNRILGEIERRQRHLTHTEKLAALGTLLSGVAHEINNPLSNISSSCQILLEEGDDADPATRRVRLAQIDEQTWRARNIVRSLLDFARKRPTDMRPQPLAPLVDEVIQFLRGEIGPGVAMEIDIPPELTVAADKQHLQHVFLNLIKNAAEAVSDTGRITLKARRGIPGADGTGPAPPGGACSADREAIEITVADDGHGIPTAAMAHVFDPFFTTKDVGKGSGLGLFIVHEIVEEHDGCITVDSTPGRGTTFRIWLPAPTPTVEDAP